MPEGPETTVSVKRDSVIRMPTALNITPLDVHAYIIPPEHKVLALWPGTTTYYEGIVLTREGAKVYLCYTVKLIYYCRMMKWL